MSFCSLPERKSEALKKCHDSSKDIEQVRNCIRHQMPMTYICTIITDAEELLLSVENCKQRTRAESIQRWKQLLEIVKFQVLYSARHYFMECLQNSTLPKIKILQSIHFCVCLGLYIFTVTFETKERDNYKETFFEILKFNRILGICVLSVSM